MIRFICYFVRECCCYPCYCWFINEAYSKEKLEELGGNPYRNRFDFAWQNAMIRWKHRDRYSRKCTGDCMNCTAKHC